MTFSFVKKNQVAWYSIYLQSNRPKTKQPLILLEDTTYYVHNTSIDYGYCNFQAAHHNKSLEYLHKLKICFSDSQHNY